MNDDARSKMFLFTVIGLALVFGPLLIALIVFLRQIGVEWWISTLLLPMGLGCGFLSVTIAARMWKV